MLRAWLHHKLGRALSSGGAQDAALRAALGRSEDALTSSTMSRVRYLPPELQWRLLSAAGPRPLNDRPWPTVVDGAPDWRFWPGFPAPPGAGGERVEPDVLLRWGPRLVIFEAKHRGVQAAWQWAREVRAVCAAQREPPGELLFVALGGLDTEGARALALEAAALLAGGAPGLPAAGVAWFQLDWPALHTAARRLGAQPGHHEGRLALLDDLALALESVGYHGERGWAPLLRVRAAQPAPTGPPALLPRLPGAA